MDEPGGAHGVELVAVYREHILSIENTFCDICTWWSTWCRTRCGKLQKRPTKETYKRDLQKRSTKETYKRDLVEHMV
jgi:hypothetical protein